ncbi:MAG: penicillin-binding protein 2 [Actinobacteria bacterium]|jgi:cell division protein FtsI/penicillin-binding protein 2|nr:penicillin-binding protein 2 [Actinomycetota bacterium]
MGVSRKPGTKDGRFVSNRRIFGLEIVVGVSILALVFQLLDVTVFPNSKYVSLAKAEGSATVSVQAPRGAILDRNGNELAVSIPKKTVVADPSIVTNPLKEASILSTILGTPVSQIRSTLIVPGQFSYVQHLIGNAQAKKIQSLISNGSLPGISLVNELTRVNPNGTLAAPVLGTLGPSGNPLSGLEYQFRNLLDGTPGQKVVTVSVSGSPLPAGVTDLVPPKPGDNLVLGLDRAIQFNTEQTLGAEIVKSQALSGSAIIMDPKNGQILAMANLIGTTGATNGGNGPVVNSASSNSKSNTKITGFAEAPTNMAVTNVYEPGSVAKIATFAAALENHVITPQSRVVVPPYLMIDGANFHDAEVHGTEVLSPEQILAQSSNIGTIIIAQHLNKYIITNSFLNFGWGKKTGLGFPGETSGFLVNPAKWSGTAIGSVPIGQDQAVSALQVLDSYNVIANNGVMVTPHFVDRVVPQDGKPAYNWPLQKRKVISPTVAATMQQLLSGTVSANGTAPLALVPGYKILGKTGTAQIPYPNKPGYQPGAFMATFVGFTQGTSTPLSAIVVLERPNPIYGGSVAAPVFSKIMSYALRQMGIAPTSGTLPNGYAKPAAFIRPGHAVAVSNAVLTKGFSSNQPNVSVMGFQSITMDRSKRA